MWGPGVRSMWHEWQANAARGYVVFFCNPRGSEGYGEYWRDAIHANWGVADAPDILAGIDATIARGGIDPARIARDRRLLWRLYDRLADRRIATVLPALCPRAASTTCSRNTAPAMPTS